MISCNGASSSSSTRGDFLSRDTLTTLSLLFLCRNISILSSQYIEPSLRCNRILIACRWVWKYCVTSYGSKLLAHSAISFLVQMCWRHIRVIRFVSYVCWISVWFALFVCYDLCVLFVKLASVLVMPIKKSFSIIFHNAAWRIVISATVWRSSCQQRNQADLCIGKLDRDCFE